MGAVVNGNRRPIMRARLPPPPRMGPPPPGMRPLPPFRGVPPPLHPLLPSNMIRGPRPRGPPPLRMRSPILPLGIRPIPGIRPHMHPMMSPPMPPPMICPPRGFRPPLMRNKLRRVEGKIIKRKRHNFNEIDLNKPWISEQFKVEFSKKEQLLKVAKGTQQASDWTAYREQRDKCYKLHSMAKSEYIGQHPDEAVTMMEDNSYNESEEEIDDTECSICDRQFQYTWQYQKHISEHKVCGIDNCTFTAHEKIVEKHIEMQHCTGLYDRMKNIDIDKWISDRKKKYPTAHNVEKRYQEQEEMLKRGERLKRNPHRFDQRNKSRVTLRRKVETKKMIKKRKVIVNTVSLIQEKLEWNEDLQPFKGTNQLYNEEVTEQNSEVFNDEEWNENQVTSPRIIPLNNALGNLMSAYNSSSEDEAPVEEKISRVCESVPIQNESKNEVTIEIKEKRKRKRIVKKNFNNKKTKISEPFVKSKRINVRPIYKRRQITLLERLLANEIVHERNLLLQCVRYVVTNEFFDKV
ncbi:hypothetical protein FQA39_LY08843 [Lamprigera yunnana]|nr:hypothetical protein FQA39_LY08843 [Lamprigera yunnana]